MPEALVFGKEAVPQDGLKRTWKHCVVCNTKYMGVTNAFEVTCSEPCWWINFDREERADEYGVDYED